MQYEFTDVNVVNNMQCICNDSDATGYVSILFRQPLLLDIGRQYSATIVPCGATQTVLKLQQKRHNMKCEISSATNAKTTTEMKPFYH